MEEKAMIKIENSDGSVLEVELVTYLISDDEARNYIVYSKGEVNPDTKDEVIYISKIVKDGDVLKVEEVTQDDEWAEVQTLLKRIANS